MGACSDTPNAFVVTERQNFGARLNSIPLAFAMFE
jgi:hypothetical protein